MKKTVEKDYLTDNNEIEVSGGLFGEISGLIYGKQILHSLSGELKKRYVRGVSAQNLWYMIQLYENYPILQSLLGEFKELSWNI